MNDLRNNMSYLSSMPNLSPSQRSRHQVFADQLSSLFQSFPDLEHGPDPLPSSTPFFTPPRHTEVYAHLTARAAASGSGSGARELVEKCRSIWGIDSPREKEREAEHLVARWSESLGTADEIEWGRQLEDAVRILTADSNELSKPLEGVLSKSLELLGDSVEAIFPSTPFPPDPPPVTLLPILLAGIDLFSKQPSFKHAVEELSDNIKGLAVQEYVVAAEQLGGMGGSKGGDSPERFEKVGGWIAKEIKNVQRSWGNGLGP
jgi:hypothetical protein